MDLDKYVNKRVKIELVNGYFYEGIVVSVDNDSLELKDKFGKDVSLTKNAILFVKEMQ